MMLSEAARALGSSWEHTDRAISAVVTDSRSMQPGGLFFALRGERFDAHDFLAEVARQQAAAAVVEKRWAEAHRSAPLAVIPVEDTRLALGTLASYWRQKFSLPLVAITGSNGKTTVKEMLASIARAAVGEAGVLATSGNFNNDIGMPLTLLRLSEKDRYAIIEMGMNHSGELTYLSRLARPTAALINNAQAAHLEGLGSIENIARAKGEILAGLGEAGIALLNADDPSIAIWRGLASNHRVVTFAIDLKADVSGSLDGGDRLSVQTPGGSFSTALQVPGLHNARNALAAAAAAFATGIDNSKIAEGLAAFQGVKGRLQPKLGLEGARFIDDSYNANPDSTKAAIAVLARLTGKRILVLGDMGELGANAAALHREVGEFAKSAGIDILLALGELSSNSVQGFGAGAMHFERIEELLAELHNLLGADVTVLVKGSRFMQMERVVKSFVSDAAGKTGGVR